MRLDQYISTNFNYTRTKAKQLIESGFILVNQNKVTKVALDVKDGDKVEILEEFKYASLGGDKLAKAFIDFNYSVKDKICIDIGASNGGFTDCMLQHGAKKVYAIDVGYGQLAWKLRSNVQVVNMERTNIRNVTRQDILDDLERL